jgi:hypothetical protein
MRTAGLAETGGSFDGTFEGLAPEPALPSQFHDVWYRTHRIAPEPRLALAVLQLAVVDLLKYCGAADEHERRLYRKAHLWITSRDREWPYSYLNLCEAIRIAPGHLRERVLSADEAQRARALREVGKLLDICHG